MVLGWPERCKLAHAFLWEYSYKRLKLAQLLVQLGVFLTKAMVAGHVGRGGAQEDVAAMKPAPDAYLRAAALLGLGRTVTSHYRSSTLYQNC